MMASDQATCSPSGENENCGEGSSVTDSVGINGHRENESPISHTSSPFVLDDCPSGVDSDDLEDTEDFVADCSYPSGVDSDDLEDYFGNNYAIYSFPYNKDKSHEIVEKYKTRLGIRSLPSK